MMGSGVRVPASALSADRLLGVGDARLGLWYQGYAVVDQRDRLRLRRQRGVEVYLPGLGDRRRAVGAKLPEWLERGVALRARVAEHRHADGAREVVGLGRGAADRARRARPREVLLQSLQLDAPRAPVVERLRGPEEEVHNRPDVRRHEPDQRRHEDEERVADSPARVLVDPERQPEPEDDGEDYGEVPGDDESRRVKEPVEPVNGRYGRRERERHRSAESPRRRRPNAAAPYDRAVAELRTERLLLRQWRDED